MRSTGWARLAVLAAATAGSLLVASFAAMAQAPAPMRLVVPYPAGGSADLSARIVAQKLSEVLGRPVLVDNRPGGGTVIASEYVAKSPPDGNTLYQINPSHIVAQSAMKNLSFDLSRDFAPVSLMASTPLMLVVNPSVPAKNVAELVALAKASPGKLNFASGGVGGITHLTGEMWKRVTGTDVVHVPYKGAASTLQGLLGGDVTMSFNDVPTYMPMVKAGKLRALAVGSPQRSPDAPDVPTMAESGYPDFQAQVWYGLLVPAATPKDVIAKLNAAIVQAVGSPAVRDQLRANGVTAVSSTPDELGRMLSTETAKWSRIVRDINLQLQ
jgi:tripartite-type tricarboxylate transporter receptor subunit TctC